MAKAATDTPSDPKVRTGKEAVWVKNLQVFRGNRLILKDLSFSVRQGEFIGIFGSNGAGKTTLFRTLLGLILPSSGQGFILGQPIKRGNPLIGYSAHQEQEALLPHLTGRDFVASAVIGKKIGRFWLSKQERFEIDRLLELVGAEALADKAVDELSGGQKQRLMLAQSLVGNPQILLMDEPFTNLDPFYRERFLRLLLAVRQELKITILLSAHDFNSLTGVMDRVMYFYDGHVGLDTPERVLTSENLSKIYQAPMEAVAVDGKIIVMSKEFAAFPAVFKEKV